ncbi:cysteine-rich small domain-containing protein [Fusobacterium perfoetens]|uniref:cysteine-rich small domain-containing protein n=1 Tax=Fusobacterium perfoetens TaxID=852 RepID=UPI0004841B77|nr:cysteine-rich small domain-containing protein [Fusobacterium perfoetens]MCI6153267.1 cysteine-rich small domain-containing protein [Fusobacterium perfoetens]MDY3238368.1 cysteine-rich small domain-containing protein [Fusobacterium perfoetens]
MENKENYKFFQNKECEYFPCHKIKNFSEKFNCLFCYCPLYSLGENCGGNFKYTEQGIKDCSNCILPHIKGIGYEHIQKNIKKVLEKNKKNIDK